MESEWKVDRFGRRYRMIGNVKEYEMMVRIDGIEMPQSQVEDFNRRKKEQEAARRAAAAAPQPEQRTCPFTSTQRWCSREDCAWFAGESCALVGSNVKPDTEGKTCPINPYRCHDKCALYRGGCTLIQL